MRESKDWFNQAYGQAHNPIHHKHFGGRRAFPLLRIVFPTAFVEMSIDSQGESEGGKPSFRKSFSNLHHLHLIHLTHPKH